jgi:hypothetical protein
MSCIINPNSSVERTRVDLVNKGLIDNFGKILDLKNLKIEIAKYTKNIQERFGLKDMPILINGDKVKFNAELFNWIDALNGTFHLDNKYTIPYMMNVPVDPNSFSNDLRMESLTSYNNLDVKNELYDKLMAFLKKVNPDFRVEVLEDLNNGDGLSINGVLKLNEFLIQIKRGYEGAIPEEVAHVLVEMLDKKSDLYKNLMSEVTRTRMYKQVFEEYGELSDYKGNYEKLKREAAAKLISLYLTDKEKFNYFTGSPNLVSNFKRLVMKVLSFIKGVKGNPFKDAAMRILEQNINDLNYKNAASSEYMYQMGKASDLDFLSTVTLNTADADVIMVSVSDVILDWKNFKPKQRYDKEGKPLSKKEMDSLKYQMYESTAIANEIKEEFFKNANLTELGKELKDKWEYYRNKVVFYVPASALASSTKEGATRYSVTERLQEVFDMDVKVIKSNPEVTEEVVNLLSGELETTTTNRAKEETIVDYIGERKAIVIDSFKDSLAKIYNKSISVAEAKPIVQPILYVNKGNYKTRKEVMEHDARLKREREFSQNVISEFDKLNKDQITKLAKNAVSIVRNIINKIEREGGVSEGSENELLNMFKDENGILVLPLDQARKLLRQIEDQGDQFNEGLLSLVNTLSSVSFFWANANKNNNYKKLETFNSKEELDKNIKEIATLMRFALNWEEYLASLNELMKDGTMSQMKVLPEVFKNLGFEVQNAKSMILEVATKLMSETLGDQASDYNAALLTRLNEGKITQKEYDQNLVTPERLADILSGKSGDVSSTAFFENGLFVGDEVLQTVNLLIQKLTTSANIDSFNQVLEKTQELNQTLEQSGLSEEEMTKSITYEDQAVVFEIAEEDADNPNAVPVAKTRPVRAFMRATQNEWHYDMEWEKVERALKALRTAREKDPTSQETKDLEKAYDKAYADFKTFEKANWNREMVTEPIEIYQQFGLDLTLLERAENAQNEIREQIKSLQSQLRQGVLNIGQQKEIQMTIESLYKELKNLRNPWSFKENRLKTESENPAEDIRIAEFLKKKHIIDRQIFEYKIDNDTFVKDLTSIVATMPESERTPLLNIIKTRGSSPTWLKDFLAAASLLENSELKEFLNVNTKVKFSDNYYESRKEVISELKNTSEQLNALLKDKLDPLQITTLQNAVAEMQDSWEKMFNLTSSLRDEDGVFDAFDTTPQHQSIVLDIENNIEDLREIIKQLTKGEAATSNNPEIKRLSTKVQTLLDQLVTIQEKNPTEAYGLAMFSLLRDIYPMTLGGVYADEDFKSLVNSKTFIKWKGELEEKKRNGTATKEEENFLSFYSKNHILTTYEVLNPKTKKLETKTKIRPSYIWMKIEPKNDEDILVVPSYRYNRRDFKQSAQVEYEGVKKSFQLKNEKVDFVNWDPIKKRWLPKLKGEYINKEYARLKNSGAVQDQLKFKFLQNITKLYLEEQLNSGTPVEGRMGYTLPYLHKRYTEGGAFSTLLKQVGQATNPTEEGEENRNKLKKKFGEKTWKQRVMSYLRGLAGMETEEQEATQVVSTDFLGNRIKRVNVPYTSYLEPENVTNYSIASVVNFIEGLNKTRALVGASKELDLLTKILEMQPPFEKNMVNKNGERVSANSNRRATIVDEMVNRVLYGDSKEYELGEFIDKATRYLRGYTVGFSQSILNPSNGLKNWMQGQLTNLITGTYAGWANEKGITKAMASAKTSYITYLHEMKQKEKSLDFQLLTLFNLTVETNITDKLTYSGYKRETGIDNMFMLSSKASEFSISATLLYSHFFSKEILINGEKKTLYDVFYLDNGKLSFKDGAIDPVTNKPIDRDYMINLSLRAKVINEHVANKTFTTTFADRYTTYKNLMFFKSFLIPAIRTRFVKKRKNLALGTEIEGFYRVFGRYLMRELVSVIEDKRLTSVTMTAQEREASRIILKDAIVSLSTLLLISFVFGFDTDDEDRYKKLKENSWLTNFLLLTILNAKKETDALTVYPFLNIQNNLTPPVIAETWNYVTEPFIGFTAVDKFKSVINAISSFPTESGTYTRNMPQYFIEKGDTKLEHTVRKFLPIDAILYIANPNLKIQVTQQVSNLQ